MDIKKRRDSLKEELAKGEEILADLDARRRDARDRMLRISSAIQVLDELLNDQIHGIYAHAGD